MRESIYNLCILYISGLFSIMGIQTDNTLILADHDFASVKENAITSAKIMIKNREYLTPTHPLNFNNVQIQSNSDRIILMKESHVGGILSVIDYIADSTSSREITRKKFSPKNSIWPKKQKVSILPLCISQKAFSSFSKWLKQLNSCQIILPYQIRNCRSKSLINLEDYVILNSIKRPYNSLFS